MCIYIYICSCDAGRLLLGHVAGDLRADVLLQPRPERKRVLLCVAFFSEQTRLQPCIGEGSLSSVYVIGLFYGFLFPRPPSKNIFAYVVDVIGL